MTRTLSFRDAMLEAVSGAMEADPSVVVLGDSVADPLPTRGSMGLVERFGPGRVIRTPIAEAGTTGHAIGMAQAGLRPLQIHIRNDFSLLAADQLINIAAKVRGMYGGAVGGVPLVVWSSIGRSWGQGAQHSQGLQSLFAHIPGLRVVMPSTPMDAKAVMSWALSPSNQDPCLIIDHAMLRKTVGPVPPGSIPPIFGSPEQGGRNPANGSDLTIVAISYMVVESLRAIAHLRSAHGVTASLFDPLWIRPMPVLAAIAGDVWTTGRLLVVDCGWPSFGVSAEIVAAVSDRVDREKKTARLGFAETVCPTSKPLENLYYPTAETIAAKAYEMVTGKQMPKWESSAPEVASFRGPF